MINVIMLSPHVQAMNYGIGAYKRELKIAFSNSGKVNLHIIKSYSAKHKEFTVETDNCQGVTYYNIPKPVVRENVTAELHTKYVRNVAFLLRPYLEGLANKVLHVNFPAAYQLAKVFKECYNIPLVSVIHFANWQFGLDGNKKRLNQIWGKYQAKKSLTHFENTLIVEMLREKELYEMSDKVIAVTQYMKNFIENYYSINSNKVTVVRNGISLDEDKDALPFTKHQLKKRWYISEDERIIVFSGRINKQKGIEHLLNAFRQVLKEDSRCRLFIIGDGSFGSSLTQCHDIWTKVSFTGYLDFSTVRQLYAIADLGIIPSLYDHCPYVVLELMKHRVPIIASNTEGLNEILSDNHDCLYVSQRDDPEGNISIDASELADAMLRILRDQELSLKLRDHAWQTLSTRHSRASMAHKAINVYDEAIQVSKLCVSV